MTPTELRAALAALSLTQAGAARRWGVDPRTMRYWCVGDRAIPGWVPVMIELEAGRRPRRCDELKERESAPAGSGRG